MPRGRRPAVRHVHVDHEVADRHGPAGRITER
ncbi:hypothetical protein Ae406Ps2_1176c [Pseudonocardia sp. Ae406_Ps2]|nr:hypothetical protein Ae406Ps2_1176c [Pseudonocardia sp. Ae406_Ps2]OLM07029.1 hypothetical protein Ae331Ps2_4739 [Pseudonocardia sp. Ae331_Ps2]OLM14222.1 hypothetical protein Ae505Ps2_4352 [Pseudonocardia sp. Ae505_Ps2]OLM22753.1 hypothetical protein Ae706Ps2_1185c [Pseudonocardia sp. Ae706_Ps2]